MDKTNLIRAFIFFIPGILLIYFPKKVNIVQNYIVKKIHRKFNLEYDKKAYFNLGIIFLVISFILLVYSIMN